MPLDKEKIIARLGKLLKQEYTLLLPQKRSCKYMVEYVKLTNMTHMGETKEYVRAAVRIVDGDVYIHRMSPSFLTVDTILDVQTSEGEKEWNVPVTDLGYYHLSELLRESIKSKVRVFGYHNVTIASIKIGKP
jgi:hypothetical protein